MQTKASPTYGSWKLESPKANQVLKNGELLITVKLLDSVTILKGSFQLLIDDNLVTNFVKFSPTQISILYLLPLDEGEHKLELHAKTKEIGYLNPITCKFFINKFSGNKKDSVIVKRAENFEFSGTISGNYKQMNTDGPGKDLAQSIPYFRDLSVDVVARVGKVSFPFKYYNTSDELLYPPTNGLPSRNYLEYGIRYRSLEFLYGDHNPVFDRLVLTGLRVKGYKFSITSPKFQMQLIDGTSQFAYEGQNLKYNPADGFAPPANLIRDTIHKNRDSTYILPGIYQRRLSAARFSFGNRLEGSTISISLLRARDDTGSIHYGMNPTDNLVIGADESFVTSGNTMRVNAGFAASIYTANIGRSAITEHQVDSFYGYKVGFNPNDYKNIFLINTTTVKPGEASTADYITAVFRGASKDKATDNQLTLDYHYYGSTYVSFGNPYARNDLWAATVGDQIGFANRKVMLSGRYTFQEDNVSASQFATLRTQLANASILLAPSPQLPMLSIFVNDQMRNTPGVVIGKFGAVSDNNLSYTGILSYNLKIGENITSLSGSFTNSSRHDDVNTFSSNTTQVISGGITESLTKLNVIIDAHYTTMNYSNEETPSTPLSNTYDGHIRYNFKKIKTFFSVGGSVTASNSNSLFGATSQTTRQQFTATISSQIVPGAIVDLEAGMAPYTDLSNSSNNYKQNYALIRLTYNFDFRR